MDKFVYKTTCIRQNRSFLRRPCVDCRENPELATDLWRHKRTEPSAGYAWRVRGSIFKRNERVILYDCFSFNKNCWNLPSLVEARFQISKTAILKGGIKRVIEVYCLIIAKCYSKIQSIRQNDNTLSREIK